MAKPVSIFRSSLTSLFVVSFAMAFAGCASLEVEPYQPTDLTKETLSHTAGSFSAGTVSGQTGVASDELLKSSLPCRMQSFKLPERQAVNVYIQKALYSELQAAEKLSAPEGRRIDIVVVKLESDTSKKRNGQWSLDFIYKIGRISRDIQTTTEFPFETNAAAACHNTAETFNKALSQNFEKFFKTLR